jgi:hypothetical protein
MFPELVVLADDVTTNDKHAPFAARSDEIAGKLRVMNMRPLPGWLLSYAHHIAEGGLYPDYTPLPMPTVRELVDSEVPDQTLGWMVQGGCHVDRWLRMDNLSRDVLRLVCEFTDVSDDQARRLEEFGNVNGRPYDHDVSRWFTGHEIERMYVRNPLWSACEASAYGQERPWRSAE